MVTIMTDLQNRAKKLEQVQELYAKNPVSFHIYGASLGKNAYLALEHIACTPGLSVKCFEGAPAGPDVSLMQLRERPLILVDLTAIATIRLLGLEWLFTTNLYSFAVTQGTWEELHDTLVDEKGGSGTRAHVRFEKERFVWEYAVHLGPNIGFLFKKDQTFETELAKLRVADPLLAEYLKAVRSWSETLQLTRNGIEHATWVPPKMAYRRNGHRIEGVEPELCGMPVTVYVALVTDRLACFIEEFSAHCLQNTMPTGTCLTEIPLSQRVTDLPERFHITPAKGGLPRWVLVYHNETFDEV